MIPQCSLGMVDCLCEWAVRAKLPTAWATIWLQLDERRNQALVAPKELEHAFHCVSALACGPPFLPHGGLRQPLRAEVITITL